MSVTVEVIVHAVNVRDGAGVGFNASSALFNGDRAVADNYAPGMTWIHITSPHIGYISTLTNEGAPTVQLLDIVVAPPTPPATNGSTMKVRTTDTLRVRAGWGLSSPVVTTLAPGVVVIVYANIAQHADGYTWYQLATSDQRWIAAQFTVHVDDGTPVPAPDPQPPAPAPLPPSLPWSLPFSASMRGVGLNAGGWTTSPTELSLIQKNHIEVALAVAYNTGVAGDLLPKVRAAGIKQLIVRASTTEAISTAQRFLDLTMPVLREYYQALGSAPGMILALHNEANLVSEGLGIGWQNGAGFASFFATVAQTYRNAFPGVKIGFPATSPGPAYAGVRVNEIQFISEAAAAVRSADWIGVHCYWQQNSGADFNPPITAWRQMFGNKPIVATECGPVGAAVVTPTAVLNAYRLLGNAGIPVMSWVLNGTGAYQGADWCFNNLILP